MIITVGGTPNPIISSLNEQKPEIIIFFVSKQTKEQVQDILGSLDYKPKGTDLIITESAEDLNICFRTLQNELPKKLKDWDITSDSLIVDYTGGTKTMSSAIVLATIEFSKNYSYVGGYERDKDGIGIVIDGKERMLYLRNPWDEIGYIEKKKINILFNTCRYSTAIEELEKIINKVSDEKKPFFEMIKDIAEGYKLWDNFQHKPAKGTLNKGLAKLKLYTSGDKSLLEIKEQIEGNLKFLENLFSEKKDEYIIYDLLSSAKRRGTLEKKFDDATARLYRVLEKISQVELKNKFEINTSCVDINKLPENLKDEYKLKYTDEKDNKIKTPLYAGYRILKEKENELGIKFFEKEKEIRKILDIRNNSILAHGDNTVKEEIYKDMLKLAIEFFNIDEEKIPQFPCFNL